MVNFRLYWNDGYVFGFVGCGIEVYRNWCLFFVFYVAAVLREPIPNAVSRFAYILNIAFHARNDVDYACGSAR